MPPKKIEPRVGHDPEDLKRIKPVNITYRHDENGRPICGATNRKGEACKNAPMENGRCKYHGGMVPRGAQHANFVHGRYSKYLPESMAVIVDDMMTSPDHLNQREQMAILDSMIVQALEEMGAGGGGQAWEELKKKRDDYFRAQKRRKPEDMAYAVDQIMELISGGWVKLLSMREARDTIDARRRLTESERKRRVEEDEMIPVDKVIVLLSQIGDSIRRHVLDENEKRAVLEDIRIAMGGTTTREYATWGKPSRVEIVEVDTEDDEST